MVVQHRQFQWLTTAREAAEEPSVSLMVHSSDTAQKAERMGAPSVISRSGVSSLAIELADQFNRYTHLERVMPLDWDLAGQPFALLEASC